MLYKNTTLFFESFALVCNVVILLFNKCLIHPAVTFTISLLFQYFMITLAVLALKHWSNWCQSHLCQHVVWPYLKLPFGKYAKMFFLPGKKGLLALLAHPIVLGHKYKTTWRICLPTIFMYRYLIKWLCVYIRLVCIISGAVGSFMTTRVQGRTFCRGKEAECYGACWHSLISFYSRSLSSWSSSKSPVIMQPRTCFWVWLPWLHT